MTKKCRHDGDRFWVSDKLKHLEKLTDTQACPFCPKPKCKHDQGDYWQFSVNPDDSCLKQSGGEICPACPKPKGEERMKMDEMKSNFTIIGYTGAENILDVFVISDCKYFWNVNHAITVKKHNGTPKKLRITVEEL